MKRIGQGQVEQRLSMILLKWLSIKNWWFWNPWCWQLRFHFGHGCGFGRGNIQVGHNIRSYCCNLQDVFKKRPNFCYCSFYSILSTVPFKVVPSTGDTPFPTFLPFLEFFLKRIFCDGAQFSYRIFLNLIYGLETTSFQSGFKFRKQEKVCLI